MILQKIITITITYGILLSCIFAGSLSGRVNFQGKAPKKKIVKMDADPVCGASHKTPPYRQSFVMNEDGYLKNVMVYLNNIKYDGKIPETQAVLDQNGCTYSPHVQGMIAGQELLIKNSDATLHNIHGLPKVNAEFNFAMPKVVKEKPIKFNKSEHAIFIKCDVHPWMKSYISVFDHPFFSVTDDGGNYKINNIPPGTYDVVAWQEKFQDKKTKEWITLNASVTIGEGETNHDFTFVKPKKKK